MDLDELAKQYGGVSATPESVNLDELAKKLGGTSRPVKERTVAEAFTDPAAKFASGIGSLIQFPGQIYGLTTGAIKDKDFATTGLQGLGQNIQDYAKKKLSEKLVSEEAETARKVEEAEKKGVLSALGTQIGEVVKNPLTQGVGFLAEQIPQAIPSILAAAIPGVGPAAAAELRAAQTAAKAAVGSAAKEKAAEAALKLAQDAALKSQISRGTTAAIGTGAAQQGADIGSGSFEEIKQYLMKEKGMSEPQASAEALNLARASGASGAAISLLAQKLPGAQALERALAGERLGTGRIKGAIAGALKNIPEEMVEEGGGKVTQNLALREVNPEQSLTAGLGQTLGQAALGAGLIGGGAGAISGGKPTINPEDVKNAEFEKRKAEDIQRATEKRAEIAAQMDVVKNPIGALTEADLGPELTAYVNKHRTDTGKPTLTAYSLDDVVDALPAKDRASLSAGTNTALNALIAQKTGYTDQVYTPDQVTALAEEKNVDATTPGFGDFLSRTTGINKLELMSQPQLHSAVTALQKLPTFETKQALPEGNNATRYTPEQLTQAVAGLNAKMDEVGKDELSLKETTKVVEATTGLKGSAVDALLNDATKSGSIVTEGKNVSVPSRTTPTGYNIQEEIGQEEEQADSYDIMRGDEKLRTMDNQEQADAYVEKLNRLTETELKKTEADLKAEDDKITKSEEGLLKLTLEGKGNTPEYQAAELAHQAVLDAAMPVIGELKAKQESYSTPLTVAPIGLKKVQPKTYRVTKGETVKGTKATREEAEQSIFEDLSDKEIQELAKTKSPKLQARVNAEIARRATAPEPKTAEQTQKIQAAQATLQSMLGRFGLQDVALKIVDAIEQGADGSYAAKVIQLAIDAQNPVRVMRHESLHALKELGFFTDSQWASLERQAKAEWVDKYLKNNQTKTSDGRVISRYDAYVEMGLNEADILEEAIADAFGDFDSTKAPPGMLTALLNKLRNFFSTLKSYLNAQGYESYKDIFGKIEKGELKPSKPAEPSKEAKKSLPVVPEQRSYKLDIEREKRKVAKSASLTQEETDAVMADAERLNLNDAQIKEIINGIKDDKKRYPSSQGWADLKVIGVDSKLDDDGKPIAGTETPKYAPISYAYNVPPGASKAPNKVDQVWLGKVTNKFQGLIQDLYKRAADGDVNAKNIIAHQTWYKNVAATLRQEFGGFGDTLADLLGATSPNTPVDTNWRFSIDVMRRFVRGDFDTEMRKFVKYLDDGKSPSKYPAEDKIRQITGKLYGMNSTNAMLALADTWRAIKPGQAPKARNFALNLIGQSNMATIDVWAARMLRRAADMVKGAKFPRIPPPAEQGVSGTWNADATKVTGAFGFGAEVMQKVSDNLAKKGINIAPPDLQAIAWFAEKELWGTKGWTTKTGEGGSFEENIEGQPTERYIAGHSVQQGSEKPETDAVKQAQGQVTRLLSKDTGVLAFRVKQTAGLYGGEVEESFDTEIVVDKGKFDPTDLIKSLSRISKENNQWDIFVSKVLAPAQERSLNARPGVEIYFKTPQDMAKIMPILEKFTSRGQDGFTLAVDPRVDDGTEQYMGVRLQYVPEISMRWDEDLRQQFLTPTGLSKVMNEKRALLDDIVADVAQMDGVAYASAVDYDTVVIGKENYSDYINGRTAGADQTVGKNPWFGEPLREHVERAITRLEGKQGQVDEGDVPSVDEEPTQKLSLRTSFPTAEAAEDAAYRKAPPTTDAFKRWFGDSEITEEGRPQVMYHASMEDFPAFRENRAIFVSPDPYFVEDFIQRRINESGSLQYLSEGNLKNKTAKIYPVWIRAEKPFDYENPNHVQQVVDDVTADFTSKEKGNRIQLATHLVSPKDLFDRLSNAQWDYIEDGRIQQAIKKLGFDSFYTLEGGAKNLALYDANQVKSATGNTGEFGETKDMRFSLSPAEQELVDDGKARQSILDRFSPDLNSKLQKYIEADRNSYGTQVGRYEGKEAQRLKMLEGRARSAYEKGFDLEFPKSDITAANIFAFAERSGRWQKYDDLVKPKLSFPSIANQIAQTKNGKNANQRILDTTTAREEEGFIERMMSAISPEARSKFRASAINRYNQMSVNDKKMAQAMGGIELLADSSAEAAALQSDTSAGVAAAVMGYGESKGGVPVYEKGYTTVSDLNGTVKGLTELLMPLAKRGDPYIYRAFQFYSGVRRGTRLEATSNGKYKEELFDTKDLKFADDLELLYPEFKQVHADWIKYNNGHVDYMVKTGVLTPEKGNIFKKYADYIPFYRQLEGEETFGPNIFQSLSNVKAPKKAKGSEAPLADFLETVVRNTQASVQSGMKNIAATRAIDQALFLGTAVQLPQLSSAPDTVTILRNGIPVSYALSDRLLFDAMQSLHLPEMPFLGILSGPANLLRNLVTKDPGFMLANMMRDSLSAYATSGANMTPIVDTIRNFGAVMANRSPEFQALVNAGVIGGYEFSRDVASSGRDLAKDLRKKSGTQVGSEKALRPITSLWGFLEKGTEASDAATRIAVYKDVMKRTGNEAEAIRQAAEVMNFNRKGSSAVIRIVTAAIPFLNARIQGLDVLYRAGMAPRPEGVNKTDYQKMVQKNFLIRGATMMALSSMYWFMMKDDDEYKKQEQEVRDNNWIIPMINARIPIPFEVGVLFKVIPERILAYMFGSDTGEDLAKSMERALRSTFAVNYIPQVVLPLVEATTNYSYFTMRPIVSAGVEGIRPGLQVGSNTTQIAETVGKAINVSPILIDHIIQGYTGTMGMYLVNAVDSVFDAMSDKQKPSLRIEQYPILKRFMIDSEAKGSVSAYFDLKKAVDETVRTVNALQASGQGEELADFVEGKHRLFGLDTASLLGARGFITDMDAKMKPLLENARKIRASEMDPDEKREQLSTINEALIAMTSNIQEIKKGLSQ